jgi:hypothetical protein
MFENAFPLCATLADPSNIHTMSMRGGNTHVGDCVGALNVGDVGASEGRTVGASEGRNVGVTVI